MKIRKFLAALAAVAATTAVAWGLSIPLITGAQDPSQLNATLNSLIQSLNTLVTPQTMAPFTNFRNVLDNGNMAIYQRGTVGTTITTCGTTTIPQTAYGADRWGCNANAAAGAGRMKVVTTGPTPPAGFTASEQLYRTSGVSPQPTCAMQEIGTVNSTALAGQSVVVSVYEQPLAGLVADNGGAFNVYIFTGTGTDEGFGTFTATTAITPAWTGIATTGSFSFTNAAAAWVRVSGSAVIPATTTEIAAAICFTPTASGAGVTDGLAFTGFQLEVSPSGQASPYEFKPPGYETVEANRYFYSITEAAATVLQSPSGNGASTTTCTLNIPFPVTMRSAPTFVAWGTALSASTWTITHIVTATALSTPYLAVLGANTPTGGSLTATVASGLTTGQTCALTGAGGGSIIGFSADY